MGIKINVSGDFLITDDFCDIQLLDKSVIDLFHNSDFNVVNLEGPITEDTLSNRINKTGPHLRTSVKTILPVFSQLKVNIAVLANNHILDYGSKGLSDTLETLRKHGISTVGAGMNLKNSSKPLPLDNGSVKIGILNFTENEWSTAEINKPGANPMDIIDNVKQIRDAKLEFDKVLCIVHGGHEYFSYPSPRMLKQYRFYVDNGADAIISHHTHCIGGYEIYKAAPIFYGLGNFIFTLSSKHEEWYKGMLLRLNIEKDSPVTFELFPVQQENSTFFTSLLIHKEKEQILIDLNEINNIIADETKLEHIWSTYIYEKTQQYLLDTSPINSLNNRYLRAVLFRLKIWKVLLRKQYLSTILNLIRCESHCDTLQTVLSNQLIGKNLSYDEKNK